MTVIANLGNPPNETADPMRSGIDMSQSRQTDVLRAVAGPQSRGERKFPRRGLNTAVDYAVDKNVRRDLIRNISGGGVFIGTRSPLPVGTNISLAFKLSDSEDPVGFKGEVVRNDPDGMGVQFKWERGLF